MSSPGGRRHSPGGFTRSRPDRKRLVGVALALGLFILLSPGARAAAAGVVLLASPGDAPTPEGTAGPAATPSIPLATEQADGSIVHEVQAGETLIGVAAAYGIPLEELLALNDLGPNTWIFPGDVLLIQLPHTPTPTPSPTVTATPPPPTRRPTRTPAAVTPAALLAGTRTPTPTATPADDVLSRLMLEGGRSPLLLGIVGVAFLLLVIPLAAGLRRSR